MLEMPRFPVGRFSGTTYTLFSVYPVFLAIHLRVKLMIYQALLYLIKLLVLPTLNLTYMKKLV